MLVRGIGALRPPLPALVADSDGIGLVGADYRTPGLDGVAALAVDEPIRNILGRFDVHLRATAMTDKLLFCQRLTVADAASAATTRARLSGSDVQYSARIPCKLQRLFP